MLLGFIREVDALEENGRDGVLLAPKKTKGCGEILKALLPLRNLLKDTSLRLLGFLGKIPQLRAFLAHGSGTLS